MPTPPKSRSGTSGQSSYRTEGPYSDSRRPDYVKFVSSLEANLARRDFTMNAIAVGLDGGLRVMRALRFGAVFGYGIEGKRPRPSVKTAIC